MHAQVSSWVRGYAELSQQQRLSRCCCCCCCGLLSMTSPRAPGGALFMKYCSAAFLALRASASFPLRLWRCSEALSSSKFIFEIFKFESGRRGWGGAARGRRRPPGLLLSARKAGGKPAESARSSGKMERKGLFGTGFKRIPRKRGWKCTNRRLACRCGRGRTRSSSVWCTYTRMARRGRTGGGSGGSVRFLFAIRRGIQFEKEVLFSFFASVLEEFRRKAPLSPRCWPPEKLLA